MVADVEPLEFLFRRLLRPHCASCGIRRQRWKRQEGLWMVALSVLLGGLGVQGLQGAFSRFSRTLQGSAGLELVDSRL